MKIFFSIVISLLIIYPAFAGDLIQYDALDKRDPFIPLVSKDGIYASDAYGVKGIKDIRLEGIVWDEIKGSIAIINGEIVRVGEKIGFLKVLKIEESAVMFDVDGETVQIDLIKD